MVFKKCGKKGYYANKCTQRRLPTPPPVSTAIVKHDPKSARVNLMNAAEAENSSDVILGNLSVNSFLAKVLFDSGASHSFMSRPFALSHDMPLQALPRTMSVLSPGLLMNSNNFV